VVNTRDDHEGADAPARGVPTGRHSCRPIGTQTLGRTASGTPSSRGAPGARGFRAGKLSSSLRHGGCDQ